MSTPVLEIVLLLATYALGASATVPLLRRLGFDPRAGSANRLRLTPLVVAAAANLAIGAACFGIAAGLDPAGAPGLGLTARDALTALAALGLTFALAAAVARGGGARRRRPSLGLPALATVCTLGAAAWMEEVLFRAGILRALRPAGLAVALAVSAALFAGIHLPTGVRGRHRLAGWGLGGLALGAVWLLTGSVWVTTAVHLARNLANVVVLEPAPGIGVTTWRTPLAPRRRLAYTAVLSVATVLLVAGVYR